MTTGSAAEAGPTNVGLRRVMQVDAWISFYAPAVFLLCVPVLVVVDVPGWVVTTVVLASALVLGGCGIVMAAVCALAAARGRLEFPDRAALEHFNLLAPVAGGEPDTCGQGVSPLVEIVAASGRAPHGGGERADPGAAGAPTCPSTVSP